MCVRKMVKSEVPKVVVQYSHINLVSFLSIFHSYDALPNPDFVLFTGDATRHFAYVTRNSFAITTAAMALIYDSLRETFGDEVEVVQLPPLDLGNNDLPNGDYDMGNITFDPCYIQDNDDGGDPILPPATNEWLQTLAYDILRETFVNEQEQAVFACGGYLERNINKGNIRLIVLNTVVFSKKLESNPTLDGCKTMDPFGQLEWLESRLNAARQYNVANPNNKVAIYITGHIPPVQESC